MKFLSKVKTACLGSIDPKCPWCDSDDIDQSAKFDVTVIGKDECVHDFECGRCNGWLTIRYSAIDVEKVDQDDWSPDDWKTP